MDRAFVLATPGMDRHLAYVGMTRHRDEATLFAGRDDFKDIDALKVRLSRARPEDSTLDYAGRRGLEPSAERVQERGTTDQPEREAANAKEPGQDSIQRFRNAQQEFIEVAGRFDLDPAAKARTTELRQEMKRSAQEISRSSALMRQAERAGILSQVRNLARESPYEPNHGHVKNRVLDRDEGLDW